MSSVDVRAAAPSEMARAIDTLVLAFGSDPVGRWAYPDAHDYLRSFAAVARVFGGKAFEHKTAYVTHDFRGTALWLPPDVRPDGDALDEIFRRTVSGQRLTDLLEMFEQMDQAHPEESHWYLPLIGVDPAHQNNGFGSGLMRHALVPCDRDEALAYLESSNPANISLYERYGFEVMGEIRIGSSPPVFPMLRRPR